jgi:hypothetical protein
LSCHGVNIQFFGLAKIRKYNCVAQLAFTFLKELVYRSNFIQYRADMKNISTHILILLISLVSFSLTSKSQSLSGNINSFSSTEDLGFANVDIYKGDELIASVLADREGNFDVKLDTGYYTCEISYAGHKKITQNIRIEDDEKADFALKKDKESKYKAPILDIVEDETDASSYVHDLSAPESKIAAYSFGAIGGVKASGYKKLPYSGGTTVSAGKLTSGEINDFSKWDLWTDISVGELGKFQSAWNLAPTNRYMVQVMAVNGLPLVDLTVQLVDDENKVLYSARTDNTGKAELWQSLKHKAKLQSGKLRVNVFYNGKIHSIKRAKAFGDGLNKIELVSKCDQSQKVDIAFVVDATGSMSDEMNYLRAELNDIIYKSKEISTSLNFSFANVFYRDHGDQYLTKVQDFTRVLSEAVSFVSDQHAGGGGDFPEAVDIALDSAINGLTWSEYARARVIFLILDAPPHNSPEIQEKLRKLGNQAAEKGIRIIPLVASGIDKSTEYLMRSLALSTNGTYAFLTNHSGIGGHHIEPSTDSYKVETLNDMLVRILKSYTYLPDCDQNMPDLGLGYSDSSVTYSPSIDSTDASDSSSEVKPVEVSWKFYPNPTRGIVNIKANVNIKELYITDLSGKVLQIIKDIQPEEAVKADLSGYASGIYLIRYPVGQKWISGKVVLLRE